MIYKVFFFIPNLIGYLRALLYLSAFIVHTFNYWQLSIILYTIAFLLDELDGRAAKKFNQVTQFGASLDMVLDRCATTGLCLILAQIYPICLVIFIILITLDISSHYYLLSISGKLQTPSHKAVTSWSKNRLLALYYDNKLVFDLLIASNELFYILLYITAYTTGFKITLLGVTFGFWQGFLLITFPLYLLKQTINVLQLIFAARQIALLDLESRKKEKTN
ncbi:MAG: CDP-alcohol phosphatidyltransferase family protein [Oscillatoria sp. PMC 1051.18]|nr:CDP-alcohol phosphatidyltransferase family protein [Oscillatoria sp. PMC 1050.18]MEC5031965.1 CDP-alcohol phosphatidyltransferase family protein [Oscillatoria sp. PMC 1051.18]